jgi:hypothetical protein
MYRKTALIIVALLLILFILFVYVFIPQKMNIVRSLPIRCTPNGAKRMILDTGKWKNWWPSGDSATSFGSDNFQFKPTIISFDGIAVDISKSDFSNKAELQILPVSRDSVILQWDCGEINSSMNPLLRIKNYQQSKELEKELQSILMRLRSVLEDEKNIYGMQVHKVKVKDSTLIATRFSTTAYPTVQQVYNAIDRLKKYIAGQNASENNFPMMHVDVEAGSYQTMIAIPVNKELPEKNGFIQKRMVLGNILEAELTGGAITVESGLKQLETYKVDHEMESPAIPFALLVTDRRMQPDTTKWVTKIYYPVF